MRQSELLKNGLKFFFHGWRAKNLQMHLFLGNIFADFPLKCGAACSFKSGDFV
jgi:hypothetical protein